MTAAERPLVSVVIIVKNGERYLAEALDSVVAQTYDSHEIVVVDGGSTDRSVEIARSYPRVRCFEQSSKGFAGAWNDGVAASTGELIAFLDSDDKWEPRKLEAQVELLQRRPEVDYVVTRMRFLQEPGHPLPHGFRPELLDGNHEGRMPSALLVRREAFEAVGPFPTDLAIANDVEWFVRAKDLPLTLGVVQEVLVHKRLHDTNLSYNDRINHSHELLAVLRKSVARRRAANSG